MKSYYILDPAILKRKKFRSNQRAIVFLVITFWLFIIGKYASIDYVHTIINVLWAMVAIYRTIFFYIKIWWDEDDQKLYISWKKRKIAFFFLYGAIALFVLKYYTMFNIFAFLAVIAFFARNDHRRFALVALRCLLQVIWYLLLDQQLGAERWAIYLYYSLVLTVVISLVNDFLDSQTYSRISNHVRKIFGKKKLEQ